MSEKKRGRPPAATPRATIQARVDESVKREIEAAADAQGLSITQYLLQLHRRAQGEATPCPRCVQVARIVEGIRDPAPIAPAVRRGPVEIEPELPTTPPP